MFNNKHSCNDNLIILLKVLEYHNYTTFLYFLLEL